MHYEGKTLPTAEINDDKNPYNLHKVYNLTVRAGMNGDGITCMIATTHPDFNATTSSKLKVLYSVRNITYTPQLKQYKVGSNITCTAQGNPTPHMEWDDVAGKTFLGNQLLITETMVGPNKWKCTARNIIRGRMHMESMTAEFAVVKDYGSTTDPVDAIPENENNSYWIIWLILGIVGLVLAVGIGALLFVKKRKNQIKNSKEMMTEEPTHHMEAQDDDSGVDDNMENGSHDAQAELPPSKYVEVNKDQIYNHEEKPLLMPSQEENTENETEDATEQQALVSPSTSGVWEIETDQVNGNGNESNSQELVNCIEDIKTKEDLDCHGKSILENIKKYTGNTLKGGWDCGVNLLQKASNLIGSPYFSQLVQALYRIVERSKNEQKLGPLDTLCQLIKLKEQRQELFRNQKSLLQLIQTFAVADNSIQSRTEILNVLVSEAEYISEDEVFIEWTDDFVLTLKALLDNGADPTWIPEDKSKTYKNTAQYEFFGAIQNILLGKSYLYKDIEKIIPLLLSKDCNRQKERYSTVLHALVNTDWEDFNAKVKTLPLNFYAYYNNVIAEVIQSNPSIVNMQDEFGNTPLQLYIQDLKIQETMISPVSNVMAKLRSDTNINMTDCESRTVLHYLTRAFPLFSSNITKEGQVKFLCVVKEITSNFNTCIQDSNGQTALNILAEKYSKEVNGNSKDMLCQLMKLWANKSNVDVQDLNRNTFLHILAKKYPNQVLKAESKDYLEIIKYIATLSNTNIQDKDDCTVLHVIAKTYDTFNPCKDIFTDLVKALAHGADINIKNNDGDTILHIFANKCAKVSHSDTKTLLQLMIYLVEQCKHFAQDGKGCTMLHIMMANYHAKHDQSQFESLVKMCINQDDTIVNVQDDQENTALHLLAGKFPNVVSTQNTTSYLEMIKDLATDITRDIKDKKGCTALQVVANNCRKDMPEFCRMIFPELVKILMSPSNINIQDDNGSTVLHAIAKRVFSDPSLGNHILPILPDITSQNVNTADNSSVTPYSWILKGKEMYMEDRDVQSIFNKIEQVFLMKGAETEFSKSELPYLRNTSIDLSSPQHAIGRKIQEADIDELADLMGAL